MRWQNKYSREDAKTGILSIKSGTKLSRTFEVLDKRNLRGILRTIQSGLELDGKRHQINALNISGIRMPSRGQAFQDFITQLLEISHFKSLTINCDTTWSPTLTDIQTEALTQAVATYQYLTTLKIKVPNTEKSAQAITTMIEQNRSLQQLHIHNLSDSTYDYVVLRAATTVDSQLTILELSHTSQPPRTFPVPTDQIRARNLNVIYQDGRAHSLVAGSDPIKIPPESRWQGVSFFGADASVGIAPATFSPLARATDDYDGGGGGVGGGDEPPPELATDPTATTKGDAAPTAKRPRGR